MDRYFRRAVALAEAAERAGNLPIGAVIVLDEEIVAEGSNAIWSPEYTPDRHAEMQALRALPQALRTRAPDMTLFTTLEPCLMCAGAIMLHHIGRVVYGAADDYGGAGPALSRLSPYFEQEFAALAWEGPADSDRCDLLFERVMPLVERRQAERRKQ